MFDQVRAQQKSARLTQAASIGQERCKGLYTHLMTSHLGAWGRRRRAGQGGQNQAGNSSRLVGLHWPPHLQIQHL
jgi:hypothetical protein